MIVPERFQTEGNEMEDLNNTFVSVQSQFDENYIGAHTLPVSHTIDYESQYSNGKQQYS